MPIGAWVFRFAVGDLEILSLGIFGIFFASVEAKYL
jgi:hypothetical protein